MSLALFISNKLQLNQNGSFSALVYRIAIGGIALGLTIMIVSFLILGGFRGAIKEKIYDFSGHIHISKYTIAGSIEEAPIEIKQSWLNLKNEYSFIKNIIPVAHKPGLLRKDNEVQGVVLKGLGTDFPEAKFNKYIIEGVFPAISDSAYTTEVMISSSLSRLLGLSLNDEVNIFFFQEPPRARRLKISGIYNTGFEDFDSQFVIGDINMIRRLNNWASNTAGSIEVHLQSEEFADSASLIFEDEIGSEYFTQRVSRKYIETFDWLQIITNNVNIFLGLILFVACFNMVSVLFILIMERTNMVGILKALGANDSLIRKVFLFLGAKILLQGLLIGNILGFAIAYLQYQFKIVKLDPESYFMEYVPIQWDFMPILAINLITLVLIFASLFIPLRRISAVQPVQSIRFD
jgi:lipoprotein-releasing system permease protein